MKGKKNTINLNPLAYNIALIGESGIGKEQPVSEPVLTEYGWIPMGKLVPGMKVYGEDGELHTITGVFPQGVKDVYRITFRDGTKTRCGLEHLWTVTTKKQRESMRKNGDYRYKVLTLEEIMKDYKYHLSEPNEDMFGYKYSVPINKPINFKCDEELEIDPYFLGLLLGDGGITSRVITFTNAEEDVCNSFIEYVNSVGQEVTEREFENHKQYIIKNGENDNYIRESLKNLNLFGCDSKEKFIPNKYLYNSIENRRKLLSGIINTDGHVHKSSIVIDTVSEKLAKDMAELIRGLGYCCHFSSYDREDKKHTEYRVSIIADDFSDLLLSNKHKSLYEIKNVSYVKSITNIELIGKEESQCIMIDNPEHLYITNDYIVTHNTTVIKEMCEKLVGEDGYLFAEMGKEDGADAINGISYIGCPEWDQEYDEDANTIGFNTLIDDIIDNKKTDWVDLKVLVVDTLDELFAIVEPEVVRMHNKENPNKKVKTINQAFGGFQAGQDKAIEVVLERLWDLKKVGVSFIVIGHTKTRNVTDPVTGEDYMQLTTNMAQKYFNAIKTKVHFLGVAAIDREIVKEKTGKKNIVTKEEEKRGVVKSMERKITFRDDNFVIDSKSRFSDIVESIPMDADELIKALTDAINKEAIKSGKSVSDIKKEQDKKAKEVAEKKEKEETVKKELETTIEKILSFCAENKSNLDVIKPVLAACKEKGYVNPKHIDNIDDAKEILSLI